MRLYCLNINTLQIKQTSIIPALGSIENFTKVKFPRSVSNSKSLRNRTYRISRNQTFRDFVLLPHIPRFRSFGNPILRGVQMPLFAETYCVEKFRVFGKSGRSDILKSAIGFHITLKTLLKN